MADLLFSPGSDVQGAAGRYRVESFLGRGGFGESYRARASEGAEVTVKVLRLERLDSWKALDLFDREARAVAGLDHPRLPRLVELFVTDGKRARALAAGETVTDALEPGGVRVVLVQTYIPGTSLQARLDAGQRMKAPEVERLARDLLDILHYLHGRDPPIIHRDLKPSNVIVDGEGRAYLIDFGAIQLRLPGAESGSTMVGTLGYFPQEQILGRAVPASDLYALGMTLVVALTGKPPEEQPHDAGSGAIRPPSGLPPPLARLVLALVQPAPGARPQTARAALDLLEGRFAMAAPPAGGAFVARRPLPDYPVLSPRATAVHKLAYRATAGGGIAATLLIHTVWFNSFSESKLVAMAPFWMAPILFGVGGLITLPRRSSLARAAGITLAGLGALFFFLYGIFPSL